MAMSTEILAGRTDEHGYRPFQSGLSQPVAGGCYTSDIHQKPWRTTVHSNSIAGVAALAGGPRENWKWLIPLDDVSAIFASAIGTLMRARHLSLAAARPLAVPIVRAKLLNDPRLADMQLNAGLCVVCDGGAREGSPLVAALSAVAGQHIFLHHGVCHHTYRLRRRKKVDDIMRATGIEV